MVDSWLAQPVATVVHPTHRHAVVLRDLLAPLGAGGNLTSDAHFAALAIEHGATLCSRDNDFSRFPGLRWVDPLAIWLHPAIVGCVGCASVATRATASSARLAMSESNVLGIPNGG